MNDKPTRPIIDEDGELILPERCPNCGKMYDEIDYEYQICHFCNYDNNKNSEVSDEQR